VYICVCIRERKKEDRDRKKERRKQDRIREKEEKKLMFIKRSDDWLAKQKEKKNLSYAVKYHLWVKRERERERKVRRRCRKDINVISFLSLAWFLKQKTNYLLLAWPFLCYYQRKFNQRQSFFSRWLVFLRRIDFCLKIQCDCQHKDTKTQRHVYLTTQNRFLSSTIIELICLRICCHSFQLVILIFVLRFLIDIDR